MPDLVSTIGQVRENAKRFSKIKKGSASKAYERFARFQHWYFFSDINEGIFAPSKFIGYRNTTLDGYSGEGNGGATERKLKRWFQSCEHGSDLFADLEVRLQSFAIDIDRQLNQKIATGKGGIHVLLGLYPDEANTSDLVEGGKKRVTVNAYERNPAARRQCLAAHGYKCRVCKILFEEFYGDLGQGFIHVHHLLPVSKKRRASTVDPVRDLCPVCPNCHAMLHREEPPLTPDELAKRLKIIG